MPDMPVSWTSTMRQSHADSAGDATNVSALSNKAGSNPPTCNNRPSAPRETSSSSMTPTTAAYVRPPSAFGNVYWAGRAGRYCPLVQVPAPSGSMPRSTASRASSAIEPTSSF